MKIKTILFLLPTILSACAYVTDMKRTGDIKSVQIPYNGAPTIEVWAPCQLILTNSDTPFIEVEGMDFIVDSYQFFETADQLKIEHKNTNWLQEKKIANITIGAPDFKKATFNSPGKITNKDSLLINHLLIVVNGKGIYTTSNMKLKGNKLSLNVFGGINKSTHHLAGKIKEAQYIMEGGTDIFALDLQTETSNIIQKSYGNIFLNAQNQLNGNIYSTGNIYYMGEPQIEVATIKSTIMKASGKLLPYHP